MCSPYGWEKNPTLVLEFYNMRRKQLLEAEPNKAHFGLAELEKHFNVTIITQNVDNLHEQAGSSKVLHLHGELMKVRSLKNENNIVTLTPDNYEVNLGDTADDGGQLRPHIVFFGEAVPAMDEAVPICDTADIFVVIGTSLNVYPAASLIHYTKRNIPLFLLDPQPAELSGRVDVIQATAVDGIDSLTQKLMHHV